jgi:hypothetical protein
MNAYSLPFVQLHLASPRELFAMFLPHVARLITWDTLASVTCAMQLINNWLRKLRHRMEIPLHANNLRYLLLRLARVKLYEGEGDNFFNVVMIYTDPTLEKLTSFNNLARVLQDQDKDEEAEVMNRRVLD